MASWKGRDILSIRDFSRGDIETILKYARKMAPVAGGTQTARSPGGQTLQDLYTIWDEKGKIEGQGIALVGDLKYGRTVHSLAYALAGFGASLTLVSPPGLEMPWEIVDDVKKAGTSVSTTHRLEDVIP